MSAISGVSSATSPHTTTNQNAIASIPKDLGVIGSKLKTGNLSAAQTALSTFQQNVQGNPPFGMNSQANADYQKLVMAVQSGDLSAAQQSLASLQTDLQTDKTSLKTGHGGQLHPDSGEGTTASLVKSLTKSSSTTSASMASPKTEASTDASSAVDSDVQHDGSLLDMTV
jgi:hypothetical protein